MSGTEALSAPEFGLACGNRGALHSEFNCDMSLCMAANVQRNRYDLYEAERGHQWLFGA